MRPDDHPAQHVQPGGAGDCRAGGGQPAGDEQRAVLPVQRPPGQRQRPGDRRRPKVNETRYLPFGGYRSGGPSTLTDRGFTGQKENMELGLLYYNARFYAPGLGRFLSADTIVPNPANPQQYNRYTYSLNSPINYADPDGHNPFGATILTMVEVGQNVRQW
ncbi:MAG: RHS repeat-associated core domain-containing protein [Chloroflexi bacterium]|nr:RHS repeat-associated core domain-containing protein [Chloroflexota bacterium]